MNLKKIKETLDSQIGKDLKEYLIVKLGELRNIDNIKEFKTPTHQSIEIKAQKRAYQKLNDIMSELLTIEEFDNTVKEKDRYDA